VLFSDSTDFLTRLSGVESSRDDFRTRRGLVFFAGLNFGPTVGFVPNWICLSTCFVFRIDFGVLSDLPDFCDLAGEGVFLVYGATMLSLRGDSLPRVGEVVGFAGDFFGDEPNVGVDSGLLNLAARALMLLPLGLTEPLSREPLVGELTGIFDGDGFVGLGSREGFCASRTRRMGDRELSAVAI